jgi:hypothetical protein
MHEQKTEPYLELFTIISWLKQQTLTPKLLTVATVRKLAMRRQCNTAAAAVFRKDCWHMLFSAVVVVIGFFLCGCW